MVVAGDVHEPPYRKHRLRLGAIGAVEADGGPSGRSSEGTTARMAIISRRPAIET
jgi:hypothetical protein